MTRLPILALPLLLAACAGTGHRAKAVCDGWGQCWQVQAPREDALRKSACEGDRAVAPLPLRTRLPTMNPADYADAYAPWKVAAGEAPPEGLAVIAASDVVGSGETDPDGWLRLDAGQEQALAQAYCAKRPLWLVFPGQTRLLELHAGEQPDAAACDESRTRTRCIGYDISPQD